MSSSIDFILIPSPHATWAMHPAPLGHEPAEVSLPMRKGWETAPPGPWTSCEKLASLQSGRMVGCVGRWGS